MLTQSLQLCKLDSVKKKVTNMNFDFSSFNRVESTGDEFTGAVICSYEATGDVHTFAKNYFSKSDKLAVVHKIIVSEKKLSYLAVMDNQVNQYESITIDNADEVLMMINKLSEKTIDRSLLALFDFLAVKFSRLN